MKNEALIKQINEIQKKLMDKIEIRPYNENNIKDFNWHYIHRTDVADAFATIKSLLREI